MSLLTGLVLYAKFNETSGNTHDYSGNGNTLVNKNNTPYVPGLINNGANLVATNSNYFYILDSNQTGLDLTGDLTFSMWTKLSSQPATDGSFQLISKNNETGNQRGYSFAYDDVTGTKRFTFAIKDVDDGRAWDFYTKNTTLPTGSFAHIIFKWDASIHTATFKVDNSSLGTSTGTQGYTSINSNTAVFSIGAYVDDLWTNGFLFTDSIIDEACVWSRLTTDAEDTELYNGGAGYAFVTTTTTTTTTSTTSTSTSSSSTSTTATSSSTSTSTSSSTSTSTSSSSTTTMSPEEIANPQTIELFGATVVKDKPGSGSIFEY